VRELITSKVTKERELAEGTVWERELEGRVRKET
jgi:hypothetical protein